MIQIYLYFIDNSLHKIQAFTTKNMADFFLSKYGGAKLILNDRFNKELAMTEGATSKKTGRVRMNKNLSNYKLKWNSDDRTIDWTQENGIKYVISFETDSEVPNQIMKDDNKCGEDTYDGKVCIDTDTNDQIKSIMLKIGVNSYKLPVDKVEMITPA